MADGAQIIPIRPNVHAAEHEEEKDCVPNVAPDRPCADEGPQPRPHPGLGYTPDGRAVDWSRLKTPEFKAARAKAEAAVERMLGAFAKARDAR